MICVSKEEAKELRRLISGIELKKTVKQKAGNRGKYYAVEEPRVLNVIKKLRGE